ncbi:MAG TPA: response regulator [Labilithrix sp.]|nr:response regulator [Labilithrix sp.]
MKVLVVEDDDEMRSALVLALSSDAAVFEACNGAVAERMLLEHDASPFDVLVTDVRMPGRSGLDLLHNLRARGSTMPVILMSGFADGGAIHDQIAPQRALLFSKPFDVDDLRTAIVNIEAAMRVTVPPRGHVLLAEDNDELRELVARALCEGGFTVRAADDGESMLELLERSAREEIPAPDALVMDIRMPRYDGLDVLRAVRLSRWNVPVVLMTAFPDEETLQRAAELGAACTLGKPLDIDDLVHAVTIVTRIARRTIHP